MKKFTSRKKFLESFDATCTNIQWSWSWVNHNKKAVYFGAYVSHEKGEAQLILSVDWKKNKKGRESPSYKEARENIELVRDKDYSLHTFRQIEEVVDEKTGRVSITDFEQDLETRFLEERRDGWYALAIGDFDEPKASPRVNEKKVYLEGSKVPVSGSRIERSSPARAACIELHGTKCCICNFDFEGIYGNLGKGFIHVHHLKSIRASEGTHVVCPKTDLRPVCPNCHAMIHRYAENRSIEEIRSLLS